MAKETAAANADKMGTMPVPKLLFSMAVPMMLSMMMNALYNVVDSVFVARLSEDALTAVSLAFPLQNIMISVGVGLGVGVSALVARMLGQGEQEKANRYAMQGVLLASLFYVIFLIVGLFFLPLYVTSQVDTTLENAQVVIDGCISYLRICCLLSFGLMLTTLMEKLLNATGRTMYTMGIQMLGAITNIILDPILIFGLLGAPKLGVAGAAWATVIGQILAGVTGLILNLKKNHDIQFHTADLRPDGQRIKEILAISVPSILMASIGSILTFFLNIILYGFSSTAVAVYGIYFKLQSFVFMPIFGLNSGMVPIISYNYGARNRERIHQTVRLAMASAVSIMLIGLAVFNLMPEQLLKMFDASEDMMGIGIPAMRTMSLSFCFAGICIICSSTCQAFGYAVYSLAVSVARQLVVLLPCAYLLSLTGEVSAIWWAWPIAELMSLAVSLLLLRRVYRRTGMSMKAEATA